MFAHDSEKESALRFSRYDENHLLSSISPHIIKLEDQIWPSVEHYFWWHVVKKQKFRDKILQSSALDVRKIGGVWYRSKIAGWKEKRRVLMTRALYTKVQMYPDIQKYLLATQDQLILETSLYDYYWGIGRDQRGYNTYGQIWMDIRKRLQASLA
ncbi:MAG: NADAR family protein [Cellvibrionaceae bacterium]|nr:NADAR family protein [Cellvibrionaceae bacterium]